MPPIFKETWGTHFSKNIVKGLRAFDEDIDITILTNKYIISKCKDLLEFETPRFIEISSRYIKDHFKERSANKIVLNWLQSPESDELKTYSSYISNKLQFKPDLIFSYSPAPFLEIAFDQVPILYVEYSLFSRPPFPETLHFDPVANSPGSVLNKIHKEIPAIPESINYKLEDLKHKIREFTAAKSPFNNLKNELLRFEGSILLPLQFSDYYIFDQKCEFDSQFELLEYTLENIPASIAVIVTQHPNHKAVSEHTLQWLAKNHPNLIYRDLCSEYMYSSQFLIGMVDVVVTVSSSIGLQALIWDTKIISLGKDYLNFCADSFDIHNISSTIASTKKNKNHYLYWILTHYAYPLDLIKEKSFAVYIGKLLEFCTKNSNQTSLPSLPIEGDIFKFWLSTFTPNLIPVKVPNKYKNIIELKDAQINEIRNLEQNYISAIKEIRMSASYRIGNMIVSIVKSPITFFKLIYHSKH